MTLTRSLAVVLLACLVASGCGRRPSSLETPSSAANEARKASGIGINQPAEPAREPVKDRPFILDPLI